MGNFVRIAGVLFASLVLVPVAVLAQGTASIGGVVRDASGAVLPGVTVEASSPALIEKARTVITDGSGQYKIEQLRPGLYTVTFTLTGFNGVRREGIELAGSFAANVNSELKVGAVEETITVTAESPLVDVQSATKQRVLSNEVLTDIPTGRTQFAAATLIAGMNLNNQDVGGTNIINTTGGSMTIHGSSGNDQRVMIDGMSTANSEIAGNASNFLPNFGSVQEMAVDYSSGTADQATGGVRINMIPREGGNVFKGSMFATGVNSSFQGDNYTQALKDRGLRTPNSIKLQYDFNPGFGGPLKENKVWFYWSGRWVKTANYVGGMFANLNAGKPNVYEYAPDPDQRGVNNAFQRSVNLRLTWQANLKNKFSVFADDQGRCQCAIVTATQAPEAATSIQYPIQRMVTAAWTSPVSNRVLLEARFGFRNENYAYYPTPAGDPRLQLIPVSDSGGLIPGLLYHGPGLGVATQPYQNTNGRNYEITGSLSYVTGTHALKTGISNTTILRDESISDNDYHVSYIFNSPSNPYVPTPIQIQQRTTPYQKFQRQPLGLGLFVQDKWTLNRLTLNLGLRLDVLRIYIPAQHLGPALLVPTRNIDLPETQVGHFQDLTPRMAAVYDLFGDGKSAVKVSLSKYVIAQGVQGAYGDQLAPVNRLANFVNRNWTDNNRNFVPDCDLTNVNAQSPTTTGSIDTCGAMLDRNFGSATPSTTINPDAIAGFGVRPYNWEFAAGIQQQVLPRMSVDIGYFRRWFGNFSVVDNRALGSLADDFGTLQRRGAARRPPARRRRLHDRQPVQHQHQPGRADRQLLHARQRLRQADPAVERHGPHGERAARRRRAAAGRRQHRTPDHRQLRDPRQGAGSKRRGEPDRGALLPPAAELPDPGEIPGIVSAAEDRRADQRDVPEHSRAANLREPGAEQRRGAAVARPAPGGRRNGDGEPGAAGDDLRGPAQPTGFAVLETPEIRQVADVAQSRPLQRVQRRHRAGGERDL